MSRVKDIDFSNPVIRAGIEAVDIIDARDVATGKRTVFVGKDVIERMRKAVADGTAHQHGRQAVIEFTADFTTDEPDRLRDAIEEIRGPGSCEYRREPAAE